ncbi:MAG: hypothetical protein AB1Z98_11945 [Nannocystaceae bacterium]
MVYTRTAIALSLLLAGCPDSGNSGSETGASSGGQTSSPTNAGSEGPCPMGSPCGNECVFLGSDENNCGVCGNVCGQGEECIAAICTDLDPCDGGPGTPCGSVCVADLDNDRNHCGECNNDCNDEEVCSGGDCVPGSPPPTTGDPTGDPPGGTTTGDPPGGTTTSGGGSTGGSSTG